MRLRVCVPFYAEFETAKPGLRALRALDGVEVVLEPRQGTYIREARNHLLNDGASQRRRQPPAPGFDAFLFVDSDIGFQAADVARLLATGKDIVAAPYIAHGTRDTYQAGQWAPGRPGVTEFRFTREATGLRAVDWVGAGFLLIRRAALEAMEYPWFREVLVEDGPNQEMAGEDLGFCLNARAAGIPIWCDFDIHPYHRPRNPRQYNWSI